MYQPRPALTPIISAMIRDTQEELIACGVPGSLIRMSCGLEGTEDLLADVQSALDAI